MFLMQYKNLMNVQAKQQYKKVNNIIKKSLNLKIEVSYILNYFFLEFQKVISFN